MLVQAAHAPGPSTSGDIQANASLEGWDSGDMEDFQEASSEVDGIPPALHLLADPTIPINIPETQVHHPVIKTTRVCTKQVCRAIDAQFIMLTVCPSSCIHNMTHES